MCKYCESNIKFLNLFTNNRLRIKIKYCPFCGGKLDLINIGDKILLTDTNEIVKVIDIEDDMYYFDGGWVTDDCCKKYTDEK